MFKFKKKEKNENIEPIESFEENETFVQVYEEPKQKFSFKDKSNECFARVKEEFSHPVKLLGKSWKHGSFIYIFLVMFISYIIINSSYITWGNITNIFLHSATIGIISLGMAMIIIAGDIDLSVGANFAFAGGIASLVYNKIAESNGSLTGLGMFVTLLVCVLIGGGIGFINGFLTGKLKMPAFISTLGSMLIFRSLCKFILKSLPAEGGQQQQIYQIYDYAQSPFYGLGNEKVLTFHVASILLIVVTILIVLFVRYAKFGRKIYAIGSNKKAASLAGIKVGWTKVAIFTLSGVLVGFASFIHLGIYGAIDSNTAGMSYELYAIASCVIGGISMTGGRGNLVGVLFGALSFQIIDKIIAALGMNPLINDTIKGAILLIAVILQIINVQYIKDFWNKKILRKTQ